MKALSYLITLMIGVWLGSMLNECTRKPCLEASQDSTVTVSTSRTVIYPKDTTIKKSFKPKPVKSFEKIDTMDGVIKSTPINVYQDSLIDSNVSITVTDTVSGEILSKEIKYKLKVPIRIIDTVKVVVTKTIGVPVPEVRRSFYVGIEAGLSIPMNKYRIAPELEYLDKKGLAYSYNYDLINGIHSAGIKKKIF